MWARKTLKNKLFAVAIVLIGALSVLFDMDATFFVATLILGACLFFANEDLTCDEEDYEPEEDWD